MFNILEAVDLYDDTWLLTFYFVLTFSLFIGTIWTAYQIFFKGDKKNKPLKENIIYNHSDDIIENNYSYPIKKENQKPINNYQLRNFDALNEEIFDDKNEINNISEINKEEKHEEKMEQPELENPYKDIYTDIDNLKDNFLKQDNNYSEELKQVDDKVNNYNNNKQKKNNNKKNYYYKKGKNNYYKKHH